MRHSGIKNFKNIEKSEVSENAENDTFWNKTLQTI